MILLLQTHQLGFEKRQGQICSRSGRTPPRSRKARTNGRAAVLEDPQTSQAREGMPNRGHFVRAHLKEVIN